MGESEIQSWTKEHCLKYIFLVSNLSYTGGLAGSTMSEKFYMISMQHGSIVNEERYQIQGQCKATYNKVGESETTYQSGRKWSIKKWEKAKPSVNKTFYFVFRTNRWFTIYICIIKPLKWFLVMYPVVGEATSLPSIKKWSIYSLRKIRMMLTFISKAWHHI